MSRRTQAALAGVAAAAVAVIVGVLLLTGGETKKPGRLAVIDGCGLLTMRFDGTDSRRLCLAGIWAAVTVSGSGKKLAWDTVSGKRLDIVFAEVDGANARPLGLLAGANVEPSLAPDGDKLAFLHSPRDDGRYDVWTTATNIDNAEQLTTSRDVSAVAWSPAGDWIAYVRGWSPETLEGDIVLIRPDGTREHQLERGDTPAWAPDGRRLAFVRDDSIWSIKPDGSGKRLLVRHAHAPAWSRDGRLLAFMRSLGDKQEQAFVVPAGGGTARMVGPNFVDPRRLLWLP